MLRSHPATKSRVRASGHPQPNGPDPIQNSRVNSLFGVAVNRSPATQRGACKHQFRRKAAVSWCGLRTRDRERVSWGA